MNLGKIRQMKQRGEKIAVLTCYDASFAALCEKAGVDILLVGDSLGMVLQGADSTLGVTVHDMQYHTRCVAERAGESYIVTDMPFGSYQQNPEQALRTLPGRARHPGLRPLGTDTAIGAPTGRLPPAGQG